MSTFIILAACLVVCALLSIWPQLLIKLAARLVLVLLAAIVCASGVVVIVALAKYTHQVAAYGVPGIVLFGVFVASLLRLPRQNSVVEANFS